MEITPTERTSQEYLGTTQYIISAKHKTDAAATPIRPNHAAEFRVDCLSACSRIVAIKNQIYRSHQAHRIPNSPQSLCPSNTP